ncbi:MAG: glycyl-radical enzyme activating protein [Candidatus Lokiarchaeota archaeon]|nr:glycyl-radical enzyme activating protein [Candidatus Lokiarchaeota archaeon]
MTDANVPASATTANVFEIQRYSTEDGPGIRTTVFLKQCPLRCAWCQNPEGIEREPSIQWYKVKCIGCKSCMDICPERAIRVDDSGVHIDRNACNTCGSCVEACPSTALKQFGRHMPVGSIVEEVAKDVAYYRQSGGGVTASGGEPAMQPEAVALFLSECKARGMSTAIETSGATTTAVLGRLLPHVDLIMYDLKEIDSEKHEAFTGMSNDKILENCKWLASHVDGERKQLWIRTPIIPGYTATDENVSGIASFIAKELRGKVQRWDLLSFNNLPADKYERMDLGKWALKAAPLLTKREMEHLLALAKASGVPVVAWSGLTRKEDR